MAPVGEIVGRWIRQGEGARVELGMNDMTHGRFTIARCLAVVLGALSSVLSAGPENCAADLPPAASRTVEFARDVYPILKSHCFGCHVGADAESGVRLDAKRVLLGETNGQPLVVVGQSAESRLIQLVAHQDPRKVMPPADQGAPLSATQIGILRAWIDQGLKWDERLLPPVRFRSDHWAFQPVRRPGVPEVARRD